MAARVMRTAAGVVSPLRVAAWVLGDGDQQYPGREDMTHEAWSGQQGDDVPAEPIGVAHDGIDVLGDDPIVDPEDDLLGRRGFAARITDVIIRTSDATESAVFGLLGPWGSGKTSLITLIESELVARQASWKVVRFNPWELSDLQSLIVEFLASIRSALPTSWMRGRRTKDAFAGLARRVSPYTGVLKAVNVDVHGTVSALADQLEGTVAGRREELAKLLREVKQPILLFVDDVDRLHPDELTTLFKLVRLVGRLPNVHYLLAFDEETIVDVLQQTGLAHEDEERALSYLEKVVQIRFDVPPLHPKRVTGLVSRLLQQIAETHGVELRDDDVYRLSGPFNAHMVTKLQQPREIKRLWAQIEALYPLVAENVDFIDFVMVTFLRTSHPHVFQALPRHRAALTGTEFDMSRRTTPEQRLDQWRELIIDCGVGESERAGVLEVLAALFVPIHQARANMTGSDAYDELARRRRVGSHLYFDWYFHLGLGPDDVPDAVLAAAVQRAEAGNVDEALAAVLPSLTSDAEGTLDRLRLVLPQERSRRTSLIGFLAAVARVTPAAGLLGRARIVGRSLVEEALLSAAVAGVGDTALEEIGKHGGAEMVVSTAVAIVTDREKQDHDQFDVEALARATAKRVRDRLDVLGKRSVEEADDEDVLALLFRWRDLCGADEPRRWLGQQVAGPWDVRDVAGLFVPIATSHGSGAPRKRLAELSVSSLAELLPLEDVLNSFAGRQPVDDTALWELEKDVTFAGRVAFAAAVLTNMWHQRNTANAAQGPARADADGTADTPPEPAP